MNNKENTENSLIKELLFKNIEENRKTRNWNVFLKLLFYTTFIIIISIIITTQKENFKNNKKHLNHIALIEISGVISPNNKTNSKEITKLLNSAFENKNANSILLKINSPGGTPVQSNIIHNNIIKLRQKYPNKKIFSIIEDTGTSGAYLISTATEKIYCDPSSIVGSIGVILTSFGFVETIEKLGIERRLYKAGKYKAIMDPFTKTNENEEVIIKNIINDIHKNFIDIVKKTRGCIISDNMEIFSGKIWTGNEALKLGIIDGLSDIQSLSLELMEDPLIINYETDSNIIELIKNIL